MGRSVIWSPSARTDLKAIVSYIANQDREAALRLGRLTIESSKQVERFESSARVVPELGVDELRELIVRNYRVIFRVRENQIQIVRVWHAARGRPEV